MTLTQGLHIAAGAMGVHQSVISIVSNNIANMNTEGYHKQRAHLGTLVLGLPIGQSVMNQVKTSAGVELINVKRYQTSFIGSYYRDQLSNQAYLDEKAKGLGDVADMFDELGGRGLDSSLKSFYDALDNLNQYPADMGARVNLLNAASTLTGTMNLIANNINQLKNKNLGDGVSKEALKNSEAYSTLESLKSSLKSLADINKTIALSQTGTLENNNLLDRRDLVLDELSKYANVDIDILSNGVANVSIGGVKLVSGSSVVGELNIQTAEDYDAYCQLYGINNTNTCNAVISITMANGSTIQNANSKFTSGKLGAMFEPADATGTNMSLDTVMNTLDTLAQTIADVFNNLQTRDGAFYLDNATGVIQLCNDNIEDYVLFVANDGSTAITAANISVNDLLTRGDGYNKIAAAYFPDYDPTDPNALDNIDLKAVGNATNIMDMIKTRTDHTGADFAPIGNLSLEEYYSGLLSKITSGLQGVQDAADAQASVVDYLNNKAASETSVDLNEELTELVKSQTAYSASARVFTTCSDLMDVLINLGR